MMQAALDWLTKNHEDIVHGLADLVAIQSISTDGEHQAEIDRTAKLTCDQMRQAGLHNVEVLKVGGSLPYAYGEWLEAPGKPTVFLYAHHDVQPINFVEQWQSDPWKLTRRDGRLFARGAADDKGAISALLGAIAAYRKTGNTLPVNIKMLVEGEEEVGSKNLMKFFEVHKQRIEVGRDRGLRHREHRGRHPEHHLLAARHRRRPGRGASPRRCRSTAAWAAGHCRTRPSP